MARILITGSADGLGRATAHTLNDQGHQVILHARSRERLTAASELMHSGASGVVGDLADLEQTHDVARQVNEPDLWMSSSTTLACTAALRCCRSTWSRRTCSPPSSTGRSGWCI